MSQYSFRSSKPDHWVSPRPHSDPSQRSLAYGPVQSMHEPSWLAKILGWY
ncbi:hypothetical protein [Erythrobacter sp. NAP1]|nr:hypothetical protein [Erythrobacter sp. NAP1]